MCGISVEAKASGAVARVQMARHRRSFCIRLGIDRHPSFVAAGAVAGIIDEDEVVGLWIDADSAGIALPPEMQFDAVVRRAGGHFEDAAKTSVAGLDEDVAFVIHGDRERLGAAKLF